MIKAIVLDIGGVLLRTEDRSGRQTLEEKYGLKPGSADRLVFNATTAADSTVGKVGPNEIWQHVADELSLAPPALEEFQRLFWQGDQIDLELLAYLKELRHSYTTALLSNAWLDARQALADQYQIIEGQTVDHILISSELGVAKPDPHIYHILADAVHCEFKHILFVDDFIENIEVAKSLDIQTIHYQAGMDLITHIQSKLDQQ